MRDIRSIRVLQVVLIAGTMALLGCGGSTGPETIQVQGTVLYQGQPLKNGTVRFAPVDAKQGRIATGPIGKDGTFVMTTIKAGDGVMPGTYKISVTSYIIPEDATAEQIEKAYFDKPAIPQKYFNPETSQLQETIDQSHSGSVELALKDD